MSADEIRLAITASPFQPFVLNLADGRAVPVIGRDFILVSPVGHSVHVYQRDGKLDWINVNLITGMGFDTPVPLTSATGTP